MVWRMREERREDIFDLRLTISGDSCHRSGQWQPEAALPDEMKGQVLWQVEDGMCKKGQVVVILN
jgi:hypothetical protein